MGGGSTPINISPIAQMTQTGLTGGTTPMGTLAGIATAVGRHGFTQSFTEHGHIIGLVAVRSDLTYQQGLNKMWSRLTRYDYYFIGVMSFILLDWFSLVFPPFLAVG